MTIATPDPGLLFGPHIEPDELVPGMNAADSVAVARILETRLMDTLDLQLVLKHVHWNVVGPNFIAVHEMLDQHVDAVHELGDDLAERISAVGAVPNGNAGAIAAGRSTSDYVMGREDALVHLAALDAAYARVIVDHRQAIRLVADLDPVTEDLLVEHTRKLEALQWLIRSFLRNPASA